MRCLTYSITVSVLQLDSNKTTNLSTLWNNMNRFMETWISFVRKDNTHVPKSVGHPGMTGDYWWWWEGNYDRDVFCLVSFSLWHWRVYRGCRLYTYSVDELKKNSNVYVIVVGDKTSLDKSCNSQVQILESPNVMKWTTFPLIFQSFLCWISLWNGHIQEPGLVIDPHIQ